MARLLRRAAVAIASAGVALSATGSAVAAPVPSPPVLSPPVLSPPVLPADHGAHPSFQVEWWYTAGTLSHSRYFWFATVWSGAQGQVARVNVVDLRRDRIVLAREYAALSPVAAGQSQFRVGGFGLGLAPDGSWRVAGGGLSLTLTPRAPYVLGGADGIIEQGPGAQSAYYSNPRMAASGALELGGRRIAVTGQGWLDHQWGNFLTSPGSFRWNWFACQFEDGRDLMLYQFLDGRDRPSGPRTATLVTARSSVSHPSRFTIEPLAPFIRPAGARARYPLRWRINVPPARIELTLRALARNQFIHNTLVPSFWEGAAGIASGPRGTCIVESTREQ